VLDSRSERLHRRLSLADTRRFRRLAVPPPLSERPTYPFWTTTGCSSDWPGSDTGIQ